MPEKHWKAIAPSRFPWEQEALDYVFDRFPAQDTYLAWSNFEFIAEDGSINEVDLLVVCPQGAFLTEIKSRPGTVSGDQSIWTWDHEGKRHTEDNPVLLANRKSKRLKSLLARQRAFRSIAAPFIEPLVFLSHSDVRCQLEAWREIFATIDRPYPEARAEAPFILSDQTAVAEGTQLVLLDLSTRLSNALDRLDIHNVGQLLRFPLRHIYRLRGVGHKTRRELGMLFKALRERLPQIKAAAPDLPPAAPPPTSEGSLLPVSVDDIARQVAVVGRGTQRQAEQQILQRYLGWLHDEGASPTLWPSQNELAGQLDLTRQRVGQAVLAGRGRWARLPAVIALRDELFGVLRVNGGIATHDEAIAAILAAHGSTLDEPARTRMASVATRAAVEAEKARPEERYDEYRNGDRIFLSVSHDLKQYALKLGLVADRLAGQDPLPSPGKVLETLRAVPQPLAPGDVPLPADNRLPALAAAASANAALTSRLELYPRGIAAERALALAQNALFGATLTVEELHSRVQARYPEAAPLPARPDLDALIQRLGLELRWNPAAADGQGAYEPTYRDTLSISTSQPTAQRFSTGLATTPPVSVEPAIAEARALEDKLQYCVREGAFLVLSVDARFVAPAQRELQRRFPLELCNLDDVFLRSLHQQADQRGARWDVVLRADAAEPQSPDWRKLQRLVDGCLPDIEKALRSSQATRLAVNPGLLARYDRMDLLARLADDVGRTGGIRGLWLLVTANDQTPMPTLNRKAIPITNAAQHVRLTEAWIANRHRAGGVLE